MSKITQKIDLSEHSLDINPRKYSVEKLDITEIEDYISKLAGSRDYEYEAIVNILKYLWGGSYNSVTDLANENWETKESIRQRFHNSKEHFLTSLPLPDKLSGVCHMATGTGKSYVIFTIAYLSILLEKVDRVLVITPPSTIIKKGLRDKFHDHLYGETGIQLKERLPAKYRNKAVRLITRNDAPQDGAIMVENVNGIYQYFHDREHNSIAQFFDGAEEVLVLSDEVHHAYKRLDEFRELNRGGKQTEAEEERRWFKFIREAEGDKIKRHVGFTGTPYREDEFFSDVIFNYSIKRAIDEGYIKEVDAILETEHEINKEQRYEQIIQTHYENKQKYSYSRDGKHKVKPITVFYCSTQKSAQKNTEEFAKILAEYLKENDSRYAGLDRSEIEVSAREKVICVVSKTADQVGDEFENVEELDPSKPGGKVEYIFSVQKLTEGWDVDNVFQIVPMQEKAFNSKLLISQVLGRGLRVPREIPQVDIKQNYPTLTITNHEKFAQHIEELLYQVTQSELRFSSAPIVGKDHTRYSHHFNLFNVRYLPQQRTVEKDEAELQQARTVPKTLELKEQEAKLGLKVTFMKGKREFELNKEFYTLDQVVAEISQRFKLHVFEREQFDFGDGISLDRLPKSNDIEKVIRQAMERAGITGDRLSRENKKIIENFFNQHLPQGNKKVLRENIEGNLYGLATQKMPQSSASAGGLDNFTSVFVSENFREEIGENNVAVIDELSKTVEERKGVESGQTGLFEQEYDFNKEYIHQLVPGKNIFTVNTSLFKTPQELVIVTHNPERTFMFQLIENSRFVNSWIKSPDKGFYSLDYVYWKGGKDRTVRSFNPDFFIKLDINDYYSRVQSQNEGETQEIKRLQDKGIQEIILAVEIKSTADIEENIVKAKNKAGQEHFRAVNKQLTKANPIDFNEEFQDSLTQHYEFFLLHPTEYQSWFEKLKEGDILQ